MIYVRCISCSYNNVAKASIRLLDKNHFLFIQEKKIMQVRAFERYIPLNHAICRNLDQNRMKNKKVTAICIIESDGGLCVVFRFA